MYVSMHVCMYACGYVCKCMHMYVYIPYVAAVLACKGTVDRHIWYTY